jgi:hypothetical protein
MWNLKLVTRLVCLRSKRFPEHFIFRQVLFLPFTQRKRLLFTIIQNKCKISSVIVMASNYWSEAPCRDVRSLSTIWSTTLNVVHFCTTIQPEANFWLRTEVVITCWRVTPVAHLRTVTDEREALLAGKNRRSVTKTYSGTIFPPQIPHIFHGIQHGSSLWETGVSVLRHGQPGKYRSENKCFVIASKDTDKNQNNNALQEPR